MNLLEMLPVSKHDTDKAAKLGALGYPAVEPVLPQILKWLKDMNWPVAMVLKPLVAGIGAPLAPYLRDVFATDDDIWKYWILEVVVGRSPELSGDLRSEIMTLASQDSHLSLSQATPLKT
jgi:Domain of unknown function (DUF5071)